MEGWSEWVSLWEELACLVYGCVCPESVVSTRRRHQSNGRACPIYGCVCSDSVVNIRRRYQSNGMARPYVCRQVTVPRLRRVHSVSYT